MKAYFQEDNWRQNGLQVNSKMILVINESYENNEAFSLYENDFNYTSYAGDSNELKQFRVVKAWNSAKRTHTQVLLETKGEV